MIFKTNSRLLQLESKLSEQFRIDEEVRISDSVRTTVLNYVRAFPPQVTEEQLVERLEKQLQTQFQTEETPLMAADLRHTVMGTVRSVAARRREREEERAAITLGEALWRLVRLTTPCAVCLAVYVWRVGVIPEYPVGALYEMESDSSGGTR